MKILSLCFNTGNNKMKKRKINICIICLASILALACNSSTVAKGDVATSNNGENFSNSETKFNSCISDKRWRDLRKSINEEVILKKIEAQPSNEEIAAFICRYRKLPNEYITKDLCDATFGTEICRGSMMWKTEKRMIGGDVYGNDPARGQALPLRKGDYHEADAGNPFNESRRLDSRIVYYFSGEKCIVYATTDHYTSFCQYPIVKVGLP